MHFGQRARFTGQLQPRLFQVVLIQVRVAQRVDEFTRLQAAHLRHHHGQQRVTGDIERHAEENVRAALVKLAGEFAVCHIKLKQCVARRQRHVVHFGGIPCGHD